MLDRFVIKVNIRLIKDEIHFTSVNIAYLSLSVSLFVCLLCVCVCVCVCGVFDSPIVEIEG